MEVNLGRLASVGKNFMQRGKTILQAIDRDAVALSLSVWILIELSLCIWHKVLGDFVAKFVDVELLIAQFVATLLVWFVSLVLAMKEAGEDPQKKLNTKSLALVLMIRDEASKVPIFFAAAIAVSVLCKIFAFLANWSVIGFAGLYVIIAWLVGAAALLLFAGLVKSS